MKKYLLISFCILTIVKAFGQDTINSRAYQTHQPVSTFEDRDTANYFHVDITQTNNLWRIGTPSKTTFNSAYSVPYALITDTLNTYSNGNISSFEFVIRTDDATFISFWHRFNTDTLADGGVIEVSTDGGASWTNIINAVQFTLTNFYSNANTISSNSNKPGFTGNSGWVKSTIYGSALNFVRFRFTFTSDNTNTNKDGWMIDSFDFTCLGTGINEIGLNSPFHSFPNPTSNFISIRSDNSLKIKTIAIKDILGKTILTTDKTTIDFSQFDSGLYFMEIMTDKGKYIERVQRK
jgi:hypothetical protein